MKPEEIRYQVTLTKSETFKLKPFGYFQTKFTKRSSRVGPRTLPVIELEIDHSNAFPMTDEQEKEWVKLMKKYNTDIFTDGGYRNFFTRTGSGMTPVFHQKLQDYRSDDGFRAAVDGDRESQGI